VLDLTGILFSTLMMLFVVIRAVRFDATRPWFEVPARPPAPETVAPTPGPQDVPPGDAIIPWRERRG
jgi:hypothetical protein